MKSLPSNRALSVLRSWYLVGSAIAALAVAIRLALAPYLVGVQFVTFFPAVVLSAYLYGKRAGMLTTVISGLAGWFLFVEPAYSFNIETGTEAFTIAAFFLSASIVALTVGQSRSALFREHAANEALQASEAQLRLGLAAAEMVAWTYELADDAVMRSDNADSIFGPGMSAQAFLERIPEADALADRARLEAAFRGESPRYESEFRYQHPDGRLLWLFNQGYVERDRAGAPLRMHGVCLDVTARKEAEVALRTNNETLEQRVAEALAERKLMADIVEGTDAFVQVVDSAFRWLAVNKAAADEFETIYGVRPVIGASMLEVLEDQPDHRDEVRAVWARALAGEVFTEMGEFGSPNRSRRCYEMKFNVLRNQQGAQIGAYQFVYDVTERVREHQRLAAAEAAQREADQLYRAYFENSPEALFVLEVSSEGHFIVGEINAAHEAGIGLKLADIRGKRIDEVLPSDAADRVIETYRHVVDTRAIYQYREVFDLGGPRQHWDTSLVPVFNEDGAVVRIVGSSRNVTRQVDAEEALRQSQKMESMGQLTGGVAHDFNNLLTPIVVCLDLLQRKGVGGDRERRLLDGAVQCADRATTLVQRLLAFARRQPLQPRAVEVSGLVEGMSHLIESTVGPRILVDIVADPETPPAHADQNQVEMAILNLVINARDAMPDGGRLSLIVSKAASTEANHLTLRAGDYVNVAIIDTGIGMDAATLARATEPFFSTKGVGKGTGLGLSMVHGLAAQLGGALEIISEVGVGTTMTLWLPVSDDAPGKLRDQCARTVHEGCGTVLLVDDEPLVRTSTADMLREMGYDIIDVGSAEHAWTLIDDGLQFDLLVTDHLMEGMTGTELARRVQARHPQMPVLIISGYAEEAGVPKDIPRLAKPFRSDELARSLGALVKEART